MNKIPPNEKLDTELAYTIRQIRTALESSPVFGSICLSREDAAHALTELEKLLDLKKDLEITDSLATKMGLELTRLNAYISQLVGREDERERIDALKDYVGKLQEGAKELTFLKSDREKVIDMLNDAAKEAGFDGYDYDTELWRSFSSHMARHDDACLRLINRKNENIVDIIHYIQAACDNSTEIVPAKIVEMLKKIISDNA